MSERKNAMRHVSEYVQDVLETLEPKPAPPVRQSEAPKPYNAVDHERAVAETRAECN